MTADWSSHFTKINLTACPPGRAFLDKPMIYFIGNRYDGPIKIGTTKNNPSKRLSALQTGNPQKIELLACGEGDFTLEKQIHDSMKYARISGEWFSRTAAARWAFLIGEGASIICDKDIWSGWSNEDLIYTLRFCRLENK